MPSISSESNVYTFKQTVLMSKDEIREFERKKSKQFKNKVNLELYVRDNQKDDKGNK